MVHAPERPTAGIRVGVWRCESASSRLGRVARLQDREEAPRSRRYSFSQARFSKDADGMNIFQGGFLGLDNIGVFDRSAPLPTGGHIAQSDGTSWMAMYALNLLAIALELAKEDPSYEDVASKFWEHFLYIAHAMNNRGDDEIRLWDEQDGFFYE